MRKLLFLSFLLLLGSICHAAFQTDRLTVTSSATFRSTVTYTNSTGDQTGEISSFFIPTAFQGDPFQMYYSQSLEGITYGPFRIDVGTHSSFSSSNYPRERFSITAGTARTISFSNIRQSGLTDGITLSDGLFQINTSSLALTETSTEGDGKSAIFQFYDDGDDEYVALQSTPSLSASFKLTWPSSLGTTGQVLSLEDDSGGMKFINASSLVSGDNLGNHIATKTITAGFGINATTGSFSALLNGTTFTFTSSGTVYGPLLAGDMIIGNKGISTSTGVFSSSITLSGTMTFDRPTNDGVLSFDDSGNRFVMDKDLSIPITDEYVLFMNGSGNISGASGMTYEDTFGTLKLQNSSGVPVLVATQNSGGYVAQFYNASFFGAQQGVLMQSGGLTSAPVLTIKSGSGSRTIATFKELSTDFPSAVTATTVTISNRLAGSTFTFTSSGTIYGMLLVSDTLTANKGISTSTGIFSSNIGVGTTSPNANSKIHIFQLVETLAGATSPSASEAVGLGSDYFVTDTLQYRIYSYKTLNSLNFYTTNYIETSTVTITGDGNGVDVSWTGDPNASGYKILRNYAGGGFVSDYDAGLTTTFQDDSFVWTSPISTTPSNQIDTYLGYIPDNPYALYSENAYARLNRLSIGTTTLTGRINIYEPSATKSSLLITTPGRSSTADNALQVNDENGKMMAQMSAWAGGPTNYGAFVMGAPVTATNDRLGEMSYKNDTINYRNISLYGERTGGANGGRFIIIVSSRSASYISDGLVVEDSGGVGINSRAELALFYGITRRAAQKGFLIRGAASQTANLFEAQNSGSNVVASISNGGLISASSGVFTGSMTVVGLTISSMTDINIGTSTFYGGIPGTVFVMHNSSGNNSTTETDLYVSSLSANSLIKASDSITGIYGGQFVGSGTATRQVKFYVSTTSIFDSGAISVTTSGDWQLEVTVVRISSNTAKTICALNTAGASTQVYTQYYQVGGLSWNKGIPLKVTGTAAGVGAATNDITAQLGRLVYYPSP